MRFEVFRAFLVVALGSLLLAQFEIPEVTELIVNPDGVVWIDRLALGLVDNQLNVRASDNVCDFDLALCLVR